MEKTNQYGKSFLLRMHPLQRTSLSLLLALLTGIGFALTKMDTLLIIIASWCVFAFTYLLSSWIVFYTRTIPQIRKYAQKEDGSKSFVLTFTIAASFAAMLTVALLLVSSNKPMEDEIIVLPVCFFSIVFSWALVHTILAFHYAHLWYDDDKTEKKQARQGLEFPGKNDPDYLDFAYFSFVIGMTFQVSDVQVKDRVMRRLVLLHGIISFLLNTFVVALTVNFIAGLKK